MIVPTHIIAKKRGRFVHVDDQNIYVPIVVEVTERATSAAMDRGYPRAGFFDQFLENAVSQISEHCSGAFVGVLRKCFLDLGINASCGHEKIGQAVIVEI